MVVAALSFTKILSTVMDWAQVIVAILTVIFMAKKFLDIRKGNGTSTLKDVFVVAAVGVLVIIILSAVQSAATKTGWLYNLLNAITTKGSKLIQSGANDLLTP